MNFSDAQLELCTAVRSSPKQLTLREILEVFVPSAVNEPAYSILQRISVLERALEILGLSVSPPIDGNLDGLRLLSISVPSPSAPQIEYEIGSGETRTVEYKESFSCCTRTLSAKSDLEPSQYKKAYVEEACLSAIAGMMNTNGGSVLVGVSDDGEPVGLGPDFLALQVTNSDRWQLYVRNKLVEAFVDGRSVSGHVQITFPEVSGCVIARFAVQPRKKLTFLKNLEHPKCPPRLFRRLDNQTVEVKPEDLEEFFAQRFKMQSADIGRDR